MWQDYTTTVPQHTVIGRLLVYPSIHSPQLNNQRRLLVWLPPSYDAGDRRFPVLYMHDGDNLFDRYASYSGEWEVDEALTALSAEGIEAIVVGVPNMGDMRRIEYNPYPIRGYPAFNGRGDDYIAFLVDTVKPLIDAEFRTLPDRDHTAIVGSSMGGLISLYGFATRPDVFGLCGAFSTAYWLGDSGLNVTLAARADGHGRIYHDVGGREGYVLDSMPEPIRPVYTDSDPAYLEGCRDLQATLLARGYVEGQNLMYVEDPEAIHREDAWARRLPAALRFLLG